MLQSAVQLHECKPASSYTLSDVFGKTFCRGTLFFLRIGFLFIVRKINCHLAKFRLILDRRIIFVIDEFLKRLLYEGTEETLVEMRNWR